MSKTREQKDQILIELKEQLKEAQLAIVINYQGLSVAEITNLRREIRPKGGTCVVTKNTLMRIAVEEDQKWKPMSDLLKGSNAFLLLKDDFGGAIKAYQAFQKSSKKTELKGGVMEGRLLKEDDLKAISELPSKEQLMAQIAGAINSITAKIAIGIKEVPNSLARAIKAYSEKDNQSETQ